MNNFNNIDPDINLTENTGICAYYSEHSIKRCFSKEWNMHILSANIRSVNKHLDEILLLIESYGIRFQIIVLSETWLNTETEFPYIPGYVPYHSIRRHRMGEG